MCSQSFNAKRVIFDRNRPAKVELTSMYLVFNDEALDRSVS